MDYLTYEEAKDFFSILFLGEHHIPNKIKRFGVGWAVNCTHDLATFDFNLLTQIVFLAHDMCYRAAIHHAGPHMMKIAIWKRERTGDIFQRHPTINQALDEWRKYYPESEAK